MRYASVCSGVEAASLAWMPIGWEAAWFSEIEPFPCAVLKERFPNVPNLGDMTKIKVENLENGDQRFTSGNDADVVVRGGVDLLVGGTPCQSFSVAGKREGLEGKSGLAKTFVELLGSIRPKWFVWENVPGCLSSKSDRGIYDFNFLLAAFAERGYSCGWRILDAQFCRVDNFPRAVPQRRRRVFIVGHIDGWEYPAEVLFEPSCLPRNNPPRRVKGKGFTSDAQRSVGAAGGYIHQNQLGEVRFGDAAGTLNTNSNATGRNSPICIVHGTQDPITSLECALPINRNGGQENAVVCAGFDASMGAMAGRPWNPSGVNPTLNQCGAASGTIGASNQELFAQNYNGLVICLNDQGGSVMQVEQDGNAGTLRANTHGNEQIVCVNGAETPVNYNTVMESIAFEPGIAKRDGGDSRFSEGVSGTLRSNMGDNQTAVAIAENIIGRQVHNGGNGVGAQEELAYTQNTSGVMGVCHSMTHATVRRLLPVECERLMGFPDNWTRISWKGKPAEECPDSLRYKACGNSMCVNVMEWIGRRIENLEKRVSGACKEGAK